MSENKNKKYFKYLDVLRGVLCIAVLLYHLNILKGGYLAVCSFFVLSGYLSTRSLLNKDKVDFLGYYISRIKKVYLPLAMVVFITLAILSFIPDLVWVSMKPETTSVLLGYNNFWQLSVNADYFARHTESPFMHLWYIGILLQFELVFPFIFVIINATKKIHKSIPSIIATLLAIGFTVFFWMYSGKAPIMDVYYNTFSRVFSLLLGVAVCFIHQLFTENEQDLSHPLFGFAFWFVLFCLIALFAFVDSQSKLFALSMIVASLLSCVLIECSVCLTKEKKNVIDILISPFAQASYEIYLTQYPAIYLYQVLYNGTENEPLRIAVVAAATLVSAFIIHFAITNSKKLKPLRILILVLLLAISSFGGYQYYQAKDNTEEMKLLEEQLAASAAEMEKQKQEYAQKLEEENNAWEELLATLEPDEKQIKNTIKSMPIICLGDSVMLGAAANIRSTFKNAYVDAEVSRSGWAILSILKGLKINGTVVIHTGTNGDVPEYVKDQMMALCKGYDVFWITVTNDRDVKVNDKLKKFVEKYDNAYLIDWATLSNGKSGWLYSDGIHLPPTGREAYTNIILDAIYQVKLAEYNAIKDEAIKAHEEELKSKISFYGNELLVGLYDNLFAQFPEGKFMADKDLDFESLKKELTNAVNDNTLTYRLVFAFDATMSLTKEQYEEILSICQGKEVTFVNLDKENTIENATMIGFGQQLAEHKEYYRPDRVHLNDQGNLELSKLIVESLNH